MSAMVPRWFTDELPTHVPSLTRRARRLCRTVTAADDLVQDTLERALRHVEQFERGTNLRAWLHRILFHLFVSSHRREQRERLGLDRLGHLAAVKAPSWTTPIPAARQRLERLFSTLPPPMQSVVALVDLDELSYREAARELNIPVGTVMSRLSRARRRLQAVVEADLCRAA